MYALVLSDTSLTIIDLAIRGHSAQYTIYYAFSTEKLRSLLP